MAFEEDSRSDGTDSLGNTFQAARQSQGMTLAQMAAITRIQEKALLALEEERFDLLPCQVFAKGFVRSYARALNIDEEVCVRLFVKSSASFYAREEATSPAFPRVEDGRTGKARQLTVLVIVSAIVLGSLVFLRAQRPASIPASPPDVVAPERRGTKAVTTNVENLPLVLELKASETTWTVVRADEGEARETILHAGESGQWYARDRFLLTLGNAGGVEATLNGRLKGPFGKTGAVVRNVELRP